MRDRSEPYSDASIETHFDEHFVILLKGLTYFETRLGMKGLSHVVEQRSPLDMSGITATTEVGRAAAA